MWLEWSRHATPKPFDVHAAMRAVLAVLHANGYRRCAEGQRTTQWCDRAEKAEAEVERLRADRGLTQPTHLDGCWKYGPEHYECARAEVERLRAALHKIAYLQHDIGRPPLISEAEAMRIAARDALHKSRGES